LFQKVFCELWCKVDIQLNENGLEDKEDKKRKTVPLKTIWESITASQEYRDLNYRERRQYGRNEFYKWIESLYSITGDAKTGKLLVGFQQITEDSEEGLIMEEDIE
jgi:hypothetical protein